MDPQLSLMASFLAGARNPEDVFGELHGSPDAKLAELKKLYHQMAKVTHPDAYLDGEEKSLAQLTFISLAGWFSQAEQKTRSGEYGRLPGPDAFTLQVGPRTYTLSERGRIDGIYNLYACQVQEAGRVGPAALRIVRDPQDNRLAENEVSTLNLLLAGEGAAKFSAYLPTLIDAFIYEESGSERQAVAFESQPGWYSLEQVHAAYPAGIDSKDMAWIWRRMLAALGFIHQNQVIHGALLPPNIWIHAEQHGLMITNWQAAVTDDKTWEEAIEVINPDYSAWYPDEVLKKEMPMPGTDIYMAAKCMVYLSGGDAQKGKLPNSTPEPIRAFLKGCALPGKKSRPQDAWGLLQEFDELIGRLWGQRKFHPFYMKSV